MARINEDRYFKTEAEAQAYCAGFNADWGGAWNAYDGQAVIVPPNGERSTWLVIASRNSSAD